MEQPQNLVNITERPVVSASQVYHTQPESSKPRPKPSQAEIDAWNREREERQKLKRDQEAKDCKEKWTADWERRQQLAETWTRSEHKENAYLQGDISTVMSLLNIGYLETTGNCETLLKETLNLELERASGWSSGVDAPNAITAPLRRVDNAPVTSTAPGTSPPTAGTGVWGMLSRTLSGSTTRCRLSRDTITSNDLVLAAMGVPARRGASTDDYDTAVKQVQVILDLVMTPSESLYEISKVEPPSVGQP